MSNLRPSWLWSRYTRSTIRSYHGCRAVISRRKSHNGPWSNSAFSMWTRSRRNCLEPYCSGGYSTALSRDTRSSTSRTWSRSADFYING